jgi:aspartyl-tRNA(Asn)/glutamyl-tRNA(Gln) amidotransferase subunit C
MEEVSLEELRHIARLARIELTEKEEEIYAKQMMEILAYFRRIDEAEVEELPPTHHVLEMANPYREDVEKPSLPAEKALQNAPARKENYIRSPRIM